MADSRLLVGMVLSLLISSVVISLMVGGVAAELGEYQIYKPVVADLTDMNESVWYEIDKLSIGSFERTEQGLVSSTPHRNTVYFVSIWPKDGIYDNTYRIKNPDNRPYYIVVRDSSFFFDSIKAEVVSNGVYIRSYEMLGFYTYEVFLPAMIPSAGTPYTIRTELNEETYQVKVWINDALIGTANDVPKPFATSWEKRQYSGLSVEGEGFTILNLESTGKSFESEEDVSVWSFIGSLAGVLAWYTDPSGNYVADVFINLIIKVQQLGIIVVLLTIIRGN